MADQRSSLPVEFLFSMRAELGGRASIDGGPLGTRVVIEVVGGTFEGPRLRGQIGRAHV